MELLPLQCPVCHSADMTYHAPSTTKNHGGRIIYQCNTSPASCSETHNTLLAGLQTPGSVIWPVRQARTEGRGCNAAARPCEKAQPTILAWARPCSALHQVLCLSALGQECVACVLAGEAV